MKFAKIEMLFLIWAVPLLLLVFFYGMKRRQRILSRFASKRGLKAIVPAADANRRWIKAGLLLGVLLLVALALAGLQYGYRWQEIERRGIDIIIALDCSKSMLAGDIQPTRLDRAKREVYDLLTMLQGDRAGLVAFAGTAFLQCPLTLDYDAFNLFLKALTPEFLPVGGTDITGAIRTSVAGFDPKANSEKALILITDGENTGDDPVQAAKNAKTAGVKLFCIGVGGGDGVPIPEKEGGFKKDKSGNIILTKLDEETLKKMALLTGGSYVRSVAGDMDLDAIYTNEIRGKMKAETLESGRKQIWEDRYQWFLGLAILALCLELFLPSVKKAVSVLGMVILLALILTPPADAGPLREGMTAYQAGEYDKALKLFIDAQLDDPDNPKILYNIGNSHYQMDDLDSAIARYKEAIEKTDDQRLKQKASYNLGNAQVQKGAYDEAVKNYEEAIAIDPEDAQAKQNLQYVKKMMEMQKQQQPSCDNKGDDSQKKDESEGEQNKSQKGEKDESEGESPSKGDDSQKKDESEGEQNESQKGDESEEEQNESQKGEKDESEEEQNESQKSPSGEEKSEDSEKDQQQPSPEYGDEMKDEQAAQQQPAPSDGGEEGDEKTAGMAPPPEEAGENEEEKQAERMLNRLQDQPGKAMIPVYRKRRVEKDW